LEEPVAQKAAELAPAQKAAELDPAPEAAEFGPAPLAGRVPIDPSAQAPRRPTSICSERSLKNS
jgi:hypothetical protein